MTTAITASRWFIPGCGDLAARFEREDQERRELADRLAGNLTPLGRWRRIQSRCANPAWWRALPLEEQQARADAMVEREAAAAAAVAEAARRESERRERAREAVRRYRRRKRAELAQVEVEAPEVELHQADEAEIRAEVSANGIEATAARFVEVAREHGVEVDPADIAGALTALMQERRE